MLRIFLVMHLTKQLKRTSKKKLRLLFCLPIIYERMIKMNKLSRKMVLLLGVTAVGLIFKYKSDKAKAEQV